MKEGSKKAGRFIQTVLIIGIAVVMVLGVMMQTNAVAKWVVRSHRPATPIVMEGAEQAGVDMQRLAQAVPAMRQAENTIRSAILYGISQIRHWNHPLVWGYDLYHLWHNASSQPS